jgi:hypothetical protein
LQISGTVEIEPAIPLILRPVEYQTCRQRARTSEGNPGPAGKKKGGLAAALFRFR